MLSDDRIDVVVISNRCRSFTFTPGEEFRLQVKLGSKGARCSRHGKECPLPAHDILVAGFSCRDLSNANPHRKELRAIFGREGLLDGPVTSTPGGTIDTLRGVIGVIDKVSKCQSHVLAGRAGRDVGSPPVLAASLCTFRFKVGMLEAPVAADVTPATALGGSRLAELVF